MLTTNPKLVLFFQLKVAAPFVSCVALPFAQELAARLNNVGYTAKAVNLGPLACVGCRFHNQSIRIWLESGPVQRGSTPCFVRVYHQIWGILSESEPRLAKLHAINYAVEDFLCHNDQVSDLTVTTLEEAEASIRSAITASGLSYVEKPKLFYP